MARAMPRKTGSDSSRSTASRRSQVPGCATGLCIMFEMVLFNRPIGKHSPRMTFLPDPPLTIRSLEPTPRTTLKRHAERGDHSRQAVEASLDEALVCHVAVVVDGSPRVLPTAHVRVGDFVYVHGARANRLLCAAAAGAPVCLTATLLDGLVFARTWFRHSMNYRSAVLFGCAE